MKKFDSSAGREVVLCDVCRVILNKNNTFEKHHSHFVDVCDKHKQYAKTFHIEIVSENLGLKEISRDRECGVCKRVLTDKEVQCNLKANSFNFLCEKHLEKYKRMFILPDNAR